MNPQRRSFIKILSSSAALAAQTPPQPIDRPNILIVMSDQHRAGLTRRSGFPLDTMPILDRMAAQGVAFDGAYTTAPLCVPARISMLTGRWPHAHRVRQNSASKAAVFDKDLFHVAKERGYTTAMVGKNHTYLTPARVDFWRPYMHLDGYLPESAPKEYSEFQNWMKQMNFATGNEPTPFPAEVQFPYRIVSDAIEFIDKSGEQPFAMWVSFPEPHNPYQLPKPYFDLFPPSTVPERAAGPSALDKKDFKWQWLRKLEESTYPGNDQNWRRTRSNYLGMLRLIDDQVGRLTQHLEARGKLKNTIVLYLSDHGDFFCDYGLVRKGPELPEVLTRIPMVWSGYGIKPQNNPSAFVSTADVMPTLCEAMSAPFPAGTQGRSLWPMLQGRDYPAAEFESVYAEVGFGGLNYGPEDVIDPKWGVTPGAPGARKGFDELNPVTQSGNMKMVRRGDWKLTFDLMGNGQLYNLANDPYELTNLFGQPGSMAVQNGLTADLLRWTIRTQDDLPFAAYKPKLAKRNWFALYRR